MFSQWILDRDDWLRWFRRLVEPSPVIQSDESRHDAALLASLMLFGSLLLGITCIAYLLLGDHLAFAVSAVSILLLLLAYGLSRTAWYRAGVLLGAFTGLAAVSVSLLLDPSLVVVGAGILVVMLWAQFFSWYRTLLAGLVVVLIVLIAPRVVFGRDLRTLAEPALLVSVAAVLGAVFAANRQRYLRQIEQRTRGIADREARYRALFDQSHDSIFLLDMEGKCITANPQWARLLGYSYDELVGTSLCDTVVERERAQAELLCMMLERGESMPPGEQTFRRKDGEEVAVEITLSVIRDSQGTPMLIQGIARDITERKRAEAQRLELETAHARMDALRQFVNETSHDLRTPISVMNTSLYLLRRKLPPEYSSLRPLDALEAQTEHMMRILENLGRISDLDDGAIPFNIGNVNLNTLVSRVLEQNQPLAQQKKLALDAQLAPNKVFVRADDVQLTRAVQNLVVNAITYTPDGGRVVVSVAASDHCALLEVRDNGIGIPPESLPLIFERFYRADTARPVHQGGLGLTITRKIIEILGGSIEVDSQPGQGSCFRVSLPVPEIQPVGELFI